MNIFMTGASGHIGGSVAVRLIEAGHAVRGLVRTAETAAILRRFNIEPVIGDPARSSSRWDDVAVPALSVDIQSVYLRMHTCGQ